VKRREFISVVSGAMVAFPLKVRSQQPVARVGYLFSFTPAEGKHLWEACLTGLRELGYEDGRNIVLEPRWAAGRHEHLPQMAAELVQVKVDVIVSAATPASLAAKAATATIPIVIVAVGDPVKTGLIASHARPGGNVTGLSLLTTEMSGKRLELLRLLTGNLARVAVVMNPDNRVSDVFWDETRAAAQASRVELRLLKARNLTEIEQAFKAIDAPAIVFDDPVIWSHRIQVAALAAQRRLPVMYGLREFVDAGGLMSYGPDRVDHYRRTASYVDKILNGAKPADLPVEQPTKFEFVINVKAAKALGLTIPPTLLARADEVIE